jgi:hypothetical protein
MRDRIGLHEARTAHLPQLLKDAPQVSQLLGDLRRGGLRNNLGLAGLSLLGPFELAQVRAEVGPAERLCLLEDLPSRLQEIIDQFPR